MFKGKAEAEVISLRTWKNACILGIDDILGTVETDKLASLVVWNKNPLSLGAFPVCVMAEGRIIRR